MLSIAVLVPLFVLQASRVRILLSYVMHATNQTAACAHAHTMSEFEKCAHVYHARPLM